MKDTGKTRYELWFGSPPNLQHLKRWGSKVLYNEKDNDKMVERAKTETFIGYTKSESQYFVWTGERVRKVTSPLFVENLNGPLSKSVAGRNAQEDLFKEDMAMTPDASSAMQPLRHRTKQHRAYTSD